MNPPTTPKPQTSPSPHPLLVLLMAGAVLAAIGAAFLLEPSSGGPALAAATPAPRQVGPPPPVAPPTPASAPGPERQPSPEEVAEFQRRVPK